ncbi:tetratricopeptide repeat protein [Anthocerotibacter panamensis]|uniref:tetratricopeptide repeat protein n=1 Tax=Anthocerotibacter panamensis TaxID=2857077 RepID=UPI001C4076C5|nr:tetratricopeptide repeat protein [Anthocerotibacter panamensis]
MATSAKFTPKVKKLGKDEMGRIQMGAALAREGRLDEAQAEFEAVLLNNPGSFRAHTAMGTILLKKKNYDGALAHFEEAMRLDPMKPQATLKAAKLYAKQGNLTKAQEYFQSTLTLDPKSVSAYVGSGQVLLQQEEYEEAILQFKKALRLEPGLASAHQRLAQAYAKLGKTAEAAAELKTSMSSNESKNPNTYARLGRMYLDQKQYIEASEAFAAAIKMNPEVKANVRLGLIEALINADKFEEAEAELKALPQTSRVAPAQHKLMGDLYTRQGLFKEATEQYQAATLLTKEGEDIFGDVEDLEGLDADENWEELADTYRATASTAMSGRKRSKSDE